MTRQLAAVEAGGAQLLLTGYRDHIAYGCLTDLYFLLRFVLRREDLRHQWLLDRCDEVQAAPDGRLDLWARGHYKSTIITFGKTIQDILRNRETTACIFSHNRPNAKSFLRQIKREFETNDLLTSLFPDVLYRDPERESPQWSDDHGLVVKRRGNPKEATLEAWGLVDAMPTGKHYNLMIFDDVVTLDSVGTPEMRARVLAAFEHSLNLAARPARRRMIGTRWHYADPYADLMSRGTFTERRHAAADREGQPVYLTLQELQNKLIDLGPYSFSSQMMLDPKGGPGIGFRDEWLRTWFGAIAPGNRYVICDPANSKRKRSDFTTFWVLEACADENLYVRDIVRDRLNLAERVETAIQLHKLWRPLRVGWEEYGMMADVQALEAAQNAQGYRFPVVRLGGKLSKEERISRLVSWFARGGIWLPERLIKPCRYSGRDEDLVRVFLDEEYRGWPYTSHDDMLDALSRIADPELSLVWPKLPGPGRSPNQHPSATGSSAMMY